MKKRNSRLMPKLLGAIMVPAMMLSALSGGMAASADELTLSTAKGSSNPSQVYLYRKGSSDLPGSAKQVRLVQYEIVLGNDYSGYTGSFEIPSQVEETGLATVAYNVTEIGGREGDNIPGALENSGLSSVTLPSGVTSVGSYAFGNSRITQVSFPTSVTSLDATAFTGTTLNKFTLNVVNQTTLSSGDTYSTVARPSPIALPCKVTDLTVSAPLTLKGVNQLTGGAEVNARLSITGSSSLSLTGPLTGTGAVEVLNTGELTLSSANAGFGGVIQLAGPASKLTNNTPSPITCQNAKGESIVVLSGEAATGDQDAPETDTGDARRNRPQITVNFGGTVAVQNNGKVILVSPFSGYRVENVEINGYSMGAITRYEFTEASSENTVVATFGEGEATEGPDESDPDPIFVFKDVDTNGWYAGSISFMVRNKIFYGVSATEFAPSDNTTRAMFATLLYRLEDFDEKYLLECDTPAPLTDVRKNSWYEDAAKWAAGSGIAPIDGTRFLPSKIITREEIAVYLYNFTKALGYEATADEGILDGYSDKDKIAPEAREAMAWAVTNGYLTGRSGQSLEPNIGAMRSEIAEILMRYLVGNN